MKELTIEFMQGSYYTLELIFLNKFFELNVKEHMKLMKFFSF